MKNLNYDDFFVYIHSVGNGHARSLRNVNEWNEIRNDNQE
jgi:hypothetical protein